MVDILYLNGEILFDHDYDYYHIKDPALVKDYLDEFLISRGLSPDKKLLLYRKHKILRYMDRLLMIQKTTELTKEHQKDLDYLLQLFPLYGLSAILGKLYKNEDASQEELKIVVRLVDTFSTVSLHPAEVGHKVAAIAKKVNIHNHTKTCRKYKTICRFNMPKLPSYKTLIAMPANEICPQDKKVLETKHAAILKKVSDVLTDDVIKSILEKYPKEFEVTKEEAKMGRQKRIDALLDKAGLITLSSIVL